jgi:hypothetical protein
MSLIRRAYSELYPGKEFPYHEELKYSAKFNDYSGNIKRVGDDISVNLSRKWQEADEDIAIGMIQCLLNKLFGTKKDTLNMDLYNKFLRNVHIAVPKTRLEPKLVESYNRVNDKYCYGLIEMPNLVYGTASTSKLGSYEYGADTISISTIFINGPEDLLDFIMYHELLHKKHKFYVKGGRSYHHVGKFKRDEKQFENHRETDRLLRSFLAKKRVKRFFGF